MTKENEIYLQRNTFQSVFSFQFAVVMVQKEGRRVWEISCCIFLFDYVWLCANVCLYVWACRVKVGTDFCRYWLRQNLLCHAMKNSSVQSLPEVLRSIIKAPGPPAYYSRKFHLGVLGIAWADDFTKISSILRNSHRWIKNSFQG